MSGLSEGEVDSIRADLLREMAGDEEAVDWAMRYIGKHVTAIVGAREAALDVLLERQRREVAEGRADLAERQMMTALKTVAKWRGEVDGLRARVEALARSWEGWDEFAQANYGESTEGPQYAAAMRRALAPPSEPPSNSLSASQGAVVVTTPGSDDEPAERRTEALALIQHNRECIARWPECESGAYDPRCCRFPKSCSADIEPERTEAREQDPHTDWPTRGSKG